MSKIERRPLPPVGKRSGSISPEHVQAYANDQFGEAWEGPRSYHSDGGLRDFDDRIEGLDRAIDQLLALEQRIPPSPGHLAALLRQMKDEQVRVVIAEPWADQKLAELVAREAGARTVVLAPAVGAVKEAGTYVDLFEHNVNALARALR